MIFQITDLIHASQLSKIVMAKDKNNDIHKEYLQFGQCIGLECVHIFVLIDKEFARKYLLEPLFKGFLEVLDFSKSFYSIVIHKIFTTSP